MAGWSIQESDILTVTVTSGDLQYVVRKSDMYYSAYDKDLVLVTFNSFVYDKFYTNPLGTKPTCFMYDWRECNYPVAIDRDDLIVKLNTMLQNGSDIKVQKNGADVGQEPTLNFIEGSNITITAVDDPTNNKVDITIDSTGGGGGGVTSVTATGLLTSSGGATPDISSQVNKTKLVGRGSVSAGIMEEITVGQGLTLSGTTLSVNASPVIYLVAHDENTQTALTRNTGYPMSIDWIDESNGITINSHSQITFSQDGVYNIQFSAQFSNNDNQLHDVDVWFQKNGAPIPWTNSRFTIQSTRGGDPGHYIAAWNFMSTFGAGDFVEIYWETDNVQVVIEKIAAANDAPDTPSIILTVDKL